MSANVFIAADAMTGLQSDLNEARVHRGVGRVHGRETVIDADVVDDECRDRPAGRLVLIRSSRPWRLPFR